MERKYLMSLKQWNRDPRRKPLMVWGARQVGKTYLIEELFAKSFYKGKYLRIDCSADSSFVKAVYQNHNLQDVLDYIEIHYGFKADQNHLLFFDEVQECLPLISMMKTFCEQRREIPVIESGSLVRIKIFRENHQHKAGIPNQFLFPVGKINQLNVYPLTFDEFLYNYNLAAYNHIKDCYEKKIPLSSAIHEDAINIFENYLFVGGMPEVVDIFLEERNKDRIKAFKKILPTIADIYDNYLADMDLYQASPESIVRSQKMYKDIYRQLNKETKNYKFSLTEKDARARDFANSLSWLTLAKIILPSQQLKERIVPPLMEEDNSLMRIYLSDMGLFTYQSGLEAMSFLKDRDNALSGIYFENYVATELVANGFPLFYWRGKRNNEFEFVIESAGHIIPIDVKKGRDKLNSLKEFRVHNKTDIAIKISRNQYGYNPQLKLLTLPFYYVPFFFKEVKSGEFEWNKLIGEDTK